MSLFSSVGKFLRLSAHWSLKIYQDQTASLGIRCLDRLTDESDGHEDKMEVMFFIKMYHPYDESSSTSVSTYLHNNSSA